MERKKELWFGGAGFDLLGLRDFDDNFAGFGEAEFFAGDGLDFVRVGPEFLYFLRKFAVFLVQASDVGLHSFDFQFGAAHGEKAVGAEDVVEKESEDAESEHGSAVLGPESGEWGLLWHEIGDSKLKNTE